MPNYIYMHLYVNFHFHIQLRDTLLAHNLRAYKNKIKIQGK